MYTLEKSAALDLSHKTAIPRSGLTAPARYLKSKNLIKGKVLDFGSGKSQDSKLLGGKKYDPHFSPSMPPGKYDTILMSYVLNTLKPGKRRMALQKAIDKLAPKGVLYASVRTDSKHLKGETSRGTFQAAVDLPYPVVAKGSGFKTYRIEKAAMEKQAIFGAGLIHVLQNIGMRKGMQNPNLAKNLRGKFTDGLVGKAPSKMTAFKEGLYGGSIIPERSILQNEVGTMGRELNQKLVDAGVTKLTSRDSAIGRLIARGDFKRLAQLGERANTPAGRIMLEMAAKKAGVPVDKLIGTYRSAKNNADKMQATNMFKDVKQVWNDPKKSPLTANIVSNLVGSSGKAPKPGFMSSVVPVNPGSTAAHASANRARLAGNTVGATGIGIIDPITGAMNLGKNIISNPVSTSVIRKSPMASNILDATQNKLVTEPITRSIRKGFAGEVPGRFDGVKNAINTYGMNSLTAEAGNSARHLSNAVGSNLSPSMKKNFM